MLEEAQSRVSANYDSAADEYSEIHRHLLIETSSAEMRPLWHSLLEVSVRTEPLCDSAQRADKALQRRLKRAIRIIERGSKLDEKGQRVGERVVAIFALGDSQKEQASVLWTNGQQLYYIESLSLKHALEFEKQFYR